MWLSSGIFYLRNVMPYVINPLLVNPFSSVYKGWLATVDIPETESPTHPSPGSDTTEYV